MTHTKWHNPMSVTQTLRFWMGPDEPDRVYEIPPGASREIPSEFDHAIHRVEKRGDSEICIGGMGPLLTRANQKYGILPALMPARDANSSRALHPEEVAARLRENESADSNPIMQRVRAAKVGAK